MAAPRTTRKSEAKPASPRTVDEYLAAAPKDARAAATKLRKTIRAAAPRATESVSYGIAGYKQNGKPLVGFGYWKAHVALYGATGSLIKTHAVELKAYSMSKGTIRFPIEKPLPVRLVTKIVKAKITELEEGD